MVSVTLKVIKTTFANVSTGQFGYPRLGYVDGKLSVYVDEEAFGSAELSSEDTVFAPLETPSVTIDEESYELEFGVDYDTTLVVPNTGRSMVVRRRVPAPELSVVKVGNHPRLSWGSSYLSPTKIYRTSIFASNNPNSDYTLVAEIDGYNIPGSANEYTDSQISLYTGNSSIAYFLHNQHGYSNEVIVSGA